MLLQGPERCNSKLSFVLKLDEFFFSGFFFIGCILDVLAQCCPAEGRSFALVNLLTQGFPLPGHSLTIMHSQEREGSTATLPLTPLAKTFTGNVGTARVVSIDGELVGDGTGAWLFPVIYLELDWAVASLGADALESPPPPGIARLLDTHFQAVGEKTESVEQRAFADTVLPDHRRHWSQGAGVSRGP